jgi:hypothetical protein
MFRTKQVIKVMRLKGLLQQKVSLRRSRVIGDFGGYRRLIVDFALFGREGLARKGSC